MYLRCYFTFCVNCNLQKITATFTREIATFRISPTFRNFFNFLRNFPASLDK